MVQFRLLNRRISILTNAQTRQIGVEFGATIVDGDFEAVLNAQQSNNRGWETRGKPLLPWHVSLWLVWVTVAGKPVASHCYHGLSVYGLSELPWLVNPWQATVTMASQFMACLGYRDWQNLFQRFIQSTRSKYIRIALFSSLFMPTFLRISRVDSQ